MNSLKPIEEKLMTIPEQHFEEQKLSPMENSDSNIKPF